MEIALELLGELTKYNDLRWVIGGGPIISENDCTGIMEPTVKGPSVTVTADNWHFHIRPERVAGIQFVEAEKSHGDLPFYYVRFSNDQEETMVRAFFPSPYMDDDNKVTELQPERLKVFEEMRDRFVGREGIVTA